MFLATTSHTDFWDFNEDLIFLGNWCKYKNQDKLNRINYKIIDYPWENYSKKEVAFQECANTYNKILPLISNFLNDVNKVSKSKLYWEIIIGDWMWRYIHIIYDRYISLKIALNKYDNISTIVLANEQFRYVKDHEEFLNLCGPYTDMKNDYYNLQLYSNILYLMGYDFPSKLLNFSSQNYKKKNIGNVKKTFKKILNLKHKINYKYFNKDFEIIYLGNFKNIINDINDVAKKLNTKHISFDFFNYINNQTKPDIRIRNNFSSIQLDDDFSQICIGMFKFCFPIDLLEGFSVYSNYVNKNIKLFPKYIFSTATWRFNTFFSYFIAEAKERNNSKLIGVQHGGGYGLMKIDPMLDYESRISDKFLTWGWGKKNNKNFFPISFLKEEKFKYHRNKQILLISNSSPRYPTIFQSCPESSSMLEYFNWQNSFISELDENCLKNLVYRKYPLNFGWETNNNFKFLNSIKISKEKNIEKDIKRSKIVVIDNNHTTLLQSLALNVPIVIFWNIHYWQVNVKAKNLINELRKVKIFHDNPASASNHINKNYDNIFDWWLSSEVQIAINNFKNEYARTTKEVSSGLTNALTSLIK